MTRWYIPILEDDTIPGTIIFALIKIWTLELGESLDLVTLLNS